jgi:hypothetical protein
VDCSNPPTFETRTSCAPIVEAGAGGG